MTSPSAPPAEDFTLAPRFGVPAGVVALGLVPLALASLGLAPLGLVPVRAWMVWPAAAVVLFGLFLALQSALLRLRFETEALVVLRQDTEIRRFPYADWIGWRVFWPAVPVLFYFRETRTPHLLPMLFDARALRGQLEQRLPSLAPPPPSR